MVYSPDTERLNPNRHEDVEEETQEQLDRAVKNLKSLTRQDGSVTSMGKAELGLLQTMLRPLSESVKESLFFRMLDFVDEDEAFDHVAAFHEAKELGMDISFNIDLMFALVSTNRRGGFSNNLIATLTDTLQHAKWANTQQRKSEQNGYKSRSPISDG